jgi:catechol 2,3-dioxygenase-like lactoylglutathione lyase family enzyme
MYIQTNTMSGKIRARYTHTNLVARDWRKLAGFYESVFGCVPVPPERDLEGEVLDRGSGVRGARIKGIHLRLPGYGSAGPTLELFEYADEDERELPVPNHPGFGHVAFEVDDVSAAFQAVLAAGGSRLGEVVTLTVPQAGTITWTYARDPEGNIIELQNWS